MSDFAGQSLPPLTPFRLHLKAAIQRLYRLSKQPDRSRWFINVSGNYAVQVHAAQSELGPKVWLTIRRGCHSREYVYSDRRIAVPEKTGLRKAYRLACHQAEHLARLRYRFL